MSDGGSEEGHDGVADVLVDHAPEAVDGLGEDGEELVDDLGDFLGIQLLAHGREARDVGEEHRDDAAIALDLGLLGGAHRDRRGSGRRGRGWGRCGSPGDRSSALGAELRARRQLRMAGAAKAFDLGSALGTELGAWGQRLLAV
ncbi:hypothetical protein D3C87_978840 [compost metagenome]